jgi:hypothetical protein
MFRKIASLLLVTVFVVSMSGCATILKDKETKMPVNSEPQGADVFLGRGRRAIRLGRTPTVVTLDNKRSAWITFRKEGYEEGAYAAKPRIDNGWMIASFLCVIGPAIVDLITQSAMSFNEKEIKITLDPILPKQAEQVNIKK